MRWGKLQSIPDLSRQTERNMTMDEKKVLRAAGLLAASAGAASLGTWLTTRFLVKVAVDRELPHGVEKAGDLLPILRKTMRSFGSWRRGPAGWKAGRASLSPSLPGTG